ncbi:hypothetical protein [Hyphomicrobium sp. D-2]|uniref:hypothetical protein n=1 Tax=Hyphomicrobium sp. D-2 TaxID=3041621 RepID=UPI002453F189|nr:hypothetical protein [Hyphomicrobium sp. D-2]MDH4983831.1 hypothetical protein [Hyphomicrobium sp. D-2]
MSGKKDRPRRGRRVSFMSAGAKPSEKRTPSITGLRFTVDTAHGGAAFVDLVEVRQRRLALAFGAALRELAPTVVRKTVASRAQALKRFFRFLDEEAKVEGPEHLRAEHIDGFESWLEAQGTKARHCVLAHVISVLRSVDAGLPGVVDEKLQQRLRYTSARPLARSTPRDAYSRYVAKQLRDAARADVLAIAQRIKSPPPIEHSDSILRECLETINAVIETEGTVHFDYSKVKNFRVRSWRLGMEVGRPSRNLHARHYLLVDDLIPFFVLLSLETGLEPECIKALRVDCLRNPAAGTVEIEYCKRRARGSEWKRLRVRDGASSTAGGIIRMIIELTAAARKHKPSENLWVYFNLGRLLGDFPGSFRKLKHNWVARHGIIDDDGKPLHLLLTHLRKTHKSLWYTKTQGDLGRFAVGHTPEIAARHYADLPSLRHLHERAVADGLSDALTSALEPVLLTPENEAAARKDPASLQLPLSITEARGVLNGKQDVWLASCVGFHKSPFAAEGEPCPEPFWGCLECHNAVITARKLPAIIAFLDFIVARRADTADADWWPKFGRAWSRITEQVLPAFSEAVVADAREKARRLEHQPYLPMEAHT